MLNYFEVSHTQRSCFVVDMDLPGVKALVKKWEKGFKAEHGRAPTKDDIKRDPTGIGEFQE